jgi:hypothetical protein
MSSKIMQSKLNTCAFCRANKHPWNHSMKNSDDEVVCVKLLNYTCPYCKTNGHTRKHCSLLAERQIQEERDRQARWEHNRQLKEEEKVRKEEEKVRKEEVRANSWASKVAKAIPEEERKKIDEEHQRLKLENEKKRAEEIERQRLENKRRWEQWYLHKMPQFYGLKKAYGDFPAGSFWEFFIEGQKYNGREVDHELAKNLREKEENKQSFINYLKIKYYNWLYDSEDTEDDCIFVWRKREADRDEREEIEAYREEQQEKREREREEDEQKERAEMDRKLATGEITHSQYREWEWEKEDELNDWLEYDSLRWYSNEWNEADRRAKWKNRKAEFENQTIGKPK